MVPENVVFALVPDTTKKKANVQDVMGPENVIIAEGQED